MDIVVITNILTPYRIPLFEALHSYAENFTVLLMAEQEENRQWEIERHRFKAEALPGFHILPAGAEVSVHINHGVVRRLIRLNPDVVLSGGFALANLAAFIYCKLFGASYVGWGELTLLDGAHHSIWRKILRRVITRGSTGSIASSSAARDAFVHYGAAPSRILTTILPFDVFGLHDATLKFRLSEDGRRLKSRYQGQVVLSIGQLIHRKGVHETLAIFGFAQAIDPNIHLLMIGDGPEKSSLVEKARNSGMTNVHLIGHVQPKDLHQYLAIADIFLFATRYDSFGLVLGEAMAAELIVVSSIHAAATRDLVEHERTGYEIDPLDVAGSGGILVTALGLPEEAKAKMGRAAYERVKDCDPKVAARAMVGFLEELNRLA